MIKKLVLGILVICFLITSVSASTLYVGGSGGYKTIQNAADHAKEGDTIIVNSGTYPEYVNLSVNNLTIQGKGYPKVNGFFDSGYLDIYATDLNINGFSIMKNGIAIGGRGSNNNIIRNNYFYSCGVRIDGDYGSNNLIKNNQFANGGISIGSAEVTIVGNTIKNTDKGIYLGSGAGGDAYAPEISGNTITGCNIGIDFYYGTAGNVYNNNFNNNINIKNDFNLNDGKLANNWNVSSIKDYNILLGPYIAGNFWGSPDGKGFSQTVSDNDYDGLADYPYVIDSQNIDYKPLVAIKAPVASFTASPTTEPPPLNVQFTDQSTDAYYWNWDFGDGTNSAEQSPMHTYSSAGTYKVTLTVSNAYGKNSKLATIVVSNQPAAIRPVANFNTYITSGYAPLSVQFTDLSENAIGWNWDFGDGSTSNEKSPFHIYSASGTFTVSLTASNANGTDSHTATITVQSQSSSDGGSSDGSGSEGSSGGSSSDGSTSGGSSTSSSGGGGGGGAGGSPEPQSNVEIKELSQTFVGNGQSVKFDFPQKVTPVVYASFDSKKTAGKVTTIAELLKEKSTLVSELPSDEVYKHLNIWIGNSGFATPENIENAVVGFKVEKSWVENKNIDQSSIALNRYSDNKWEQLQTSQSEEDDSYLYFTAETQGFSEFAITGKTKAEETITELESETDIRETETELQPETEIKETETELQPETEIKETETESQLKTDIKDIGQNKMASDVKQANEQKGKTSIPGFEIVYGIIGMLGVFLSRRR